jgi:hypothetical protein
MLTFCNRSLGKNPMRLLVCLERCSGSLPRNSSTTLLYFVIVGKQAEHVIALSLWETSICIVTRPPLSS